MGADRHSGGRGGGLRRKEGIAATAVVVGVYFEGKARAPWSSVNCVGDFVFCRSATFAWSVFCFAVLIRDCFNRELLPEV